MNINCVSAPIYYCTPMTWLISTLWRRLQEVFCLFLFRVTKFVVRSKFSVCVSLRIRINNYVDGIMVSIYTCAFIGMHAEHLGNACIKPPHPVAHLTSINFLQSHQWPIDLKQKEAALHKINIMISHWSCANISNYHHMKYRSPNKSIHRYICNACSDTALFIDYWFCMHRSVHRNGTEHGPERRIQKKSSRNQTTNISTARIKRRRQAKEEGALLQ